MVQGFDEFLPVTDKDRRVTNGQNQRPPCITSSIKSCIKMVCFCNFIVITFELDAHVEPVSVCSSTTAYNSQVKSPVIISAGSVHCCVSCCRNSPVKITVICTWKNGNRQYSRHRWRSIVSSSTFQESLVLMTYQKKCKTDCGSS